MEPPILSSSPSLVPTRCNLGCSCENRNHSLLDIEETSLPSTPQTSAVLKKRQVSNSIEILPTTTKVTIEHSSDRPLSQSLNTITQSLRHFTEDNSGSKQLQQSASDILFNTASDEKILNSNIKIPLCTCQQSKAYPYCDSTHKQFNQETNSNISPIYIKFEKESSSSNKQNSNNKLTQHIEKLNLNDEVQQIKEEVKEKEVVKVEENEKEEEEEKEEIVTQPKYTPTNIKDPLNQNNYFSLEEISAHNTVDDCWMIIQNKVYDITTYIDRHPGGKRALIRFAGKDGTENVQFHSKTMLQLLNTYYFVGHLRKDQQAVQPSRCLII